jgi:Resolvase, N terminal domain
MSLGRYRPWGQSQEKIHPEHRDRVAVIYVRQSSRQQVLEHSESTRLQYALAERAAALGWARSRIMVIDDDLGVSAATADARAGFARLVTEVTMGRTVIGQRDVPAGADRAGLASAFGAVLAVRGAAGGSGRRL